MPRSVQPSRLKVQNHMKKFNSITAKNIINETSKHKMRSTRQENRRTLLSRFYPENLEKVRQQEAQELHDNEHELEDYL